MEPRLNSGKL